MNRNRERQSNPLIGLLDTLPVTIQTLALPDPRFTSLTFPRFRPYLTEPKYGERDVKAVGMMAGSIPIGLALMGRPFTQTPFFDPITLERYHQYQQPPASPAPEDDAADDHAKRDHRRLLSLFIHKQWRRRGLGRDLLKAAEQVAFEQGSRCLTVQYSGKTKQKQALESLLEHCGWEAPQLHSQRLSGPANWYLKAEQTWPKLMPFLRRHGFETTPWLERTAEDNSAIEALVVIGEVETLLAPRQAFDQHCVPDLSFAIRRRGELVGWIIGEEIDQVEGVLYHTGYVKPALRNRGWLIGGMLETGHRQSALMGPETTSWYETVGDNPAMRRLMDERVSTFAFSIDPRWGSRKALNATTLRS
ncbi:MAG: GNAT family N-acetyltransferase [Magnetococcales bacterium]|nr:GNAT family N-acetyltransferase [Magnetococcales bacterium]